MLPVPQVLVIDGRGHLLGRLAAIVAKQVLLGECGTFPRGARGGPGPRAVMSPFWLWSLATMRGASMHYQLSAGAPGTAGKGGLGPGTAGWSREKRPGPGSALTPPGPAVPPGRRVVVVRCEGINISGNFYRNKRESLGPGFGEKSRLLEKS